MIPKYEDIYLKLVFTGTYIADPEVEYETRKARYTWWWCDIVLVSMIRISSQRFSSVKLCHANQDNDMRIYNEVTMSGHPPYEIWNQDA